MNKSEKPEGRRQKKKKLKMNYLDGSIGESYD